MSIFEDYFSQRLYGQQYIGLFRKMAITITNDYLEETIKYIEENGFAPSFEELMMNVKRLENDLLMKGTWLRDDYKKERGKRSPRLVKGFKRIINSAINDYVKRAKVLMTIKQTSALKRKSTLYSVTLSFLFLAKMIVMHGDSLIGI